MKKLLVLGSILVLSMSAFAHQHPIKHCHKMSGNYVKYTDVLGNDCHNHGFYGWHCTATQD